MSTINRDEWLKALGDAAKPPDQNAVTVMELAAMLGVGRMAAYRHMLRLRDEGKAEPTTKSIMLCSGHSKRVTAYRLLKPTKKK